MGSGANDKVKRYEHTQIGYLVITAMTAALALVGFSLASEGIDWIGIVVMVAVAIALVLFSTLTVTISEDTLEVRFGPGVIRKRTRLTDIASCRVVRNPFYYGWGIRRTPHGWLYNVSGFSAVEVKLKAGGTFRIGTDVPEELESAIRQAI
jgi:hypothetical protein